MAARLWTALLLLGAVFAMHGVQCTVAADGGARTSAPAAAGQGVSALGRGVPPLTTAVLTTVTDPVDGAHAGGAAHAGPAVGAAPGPAGHGGAPHDTAGHLWTVCLAVLAAGLAVLLAVLTPRPARPTALALTAVRVLSGSVVPRPPDLSALCLLRI